MKIEENRKRPVCQDDVADSAGKQRNTAPSRGRARRLENDRPHKPRHLLVGPGWTLEKDKAAPGRIMAACATFRRDAGAYARFTFAGTAIRLIGSRMRDRGWVPRDD